MMSKRPHYISVRTSGKTNKYLQKKLKGRKEFKAVNATLLKRLEALDTS